MSTLLDQYAAHGPGHDEMLQAAGATRAAWRHVTEHAGIDSPSQVARYRREVEAARRARGLAGPDAPPWPLDPLPVVIGEPEWDELAAATAQRLELFDALLADLYGPRHLLGPGGLPPEIVIGSPGFLREADAITGPHRLTVAGVDVARNADGSWVALTDRTDAVNGLGHAMENRRIIAEVLAPSYRAVRVRRLGPFFHELHSSLLETGAPYRPALLTAGPRSPSAFDDAALAGLLGVPLVQDEDLEVQGNQLWLASVREPARIGVLLRAVPAHDCDPLELWPRRGVPGLVHAARRGGVHLANSLGSAVLENPALLTYLPRICREVRGEELRLASAATYWCGDRAMCSHVIANIGRLVLKSARPGHRGIKGWELSIDQRAELSARIAAEPWAWSGQEPVRASTTPTTESTSLTAAPTVLRLFGAAGPAGFQVMPGGLGRVLPDDGAATALPPEGTAKDVWVVAPGATEDPSPDVALPARDVLPPRTAASLLGLGWHLEHATRTLRVRQVADGAAPESLPARLAATEELGTLAGDAHELVAHARVARSELPAEIWPVVLNAEQVITAVAGGAGPAASGFGDAPGLDDLLAHRLPGDARRAAVTAGGELARAELTLLAMSLATEQQLPQLLELLDAPAVDPMNALAALLWSDANPASVRRGLTDLRAHLGVVSGAQARPLLDDVIDLLDELAVRHQGGLAALAEELRPARWRLADLRRSLLAHEPLHVAGLPDEQWAT